MIDKLITIFTPQGINWRTNSAETLAAALSQPVALQPMTLTEFFGAVVQAGGAPSEIRKLWAYDQYVTLATDALTKGDLQGMAALIATMPVDLDAGTMQAIGAVVAAATVNVGGRQATWTAQQVTATLTAAGYTWTGTEWARA
jgi:hypothetical protein